MEYLERVGNLHMHTVYSDGSGSHREIAAAARRAGLDFVVVTDHNVFAGQHQRWYGDALVLVGEELHNPARESVNHLLVLNATEEMATFSDDPQRLLDAVRSRGALAFIAHPYEHSGALSGIPEINWVDWSVSGYHGLEIWNYMSEFKSYLSDPLTALVAALVPKLFISGPYPEAILKWDDLLARSKAFAIAGSDAHAGTYAFGPIRRQVFGYEHLFRALNTHIMVPQPWSGDSEEDAQLVYDALAVGRSFVAYDALAPARGFRFTAEHRREIYTLGEEFVAEGDVRFTISAPARARLRLMQNGFCVAETTGTELTHSARSPGAYRVEAYRPCWFKSRGWVFTNPIFIRTERVRPLPTEH